MQTTLSDTVASQLSVTVQNPVTASLQPWMIAAIVLAALLTLLLSLAMIYFFIGRVRTQRIHRQLLRDSVVRGKYQLLLEQAGLGQGTPNQDPRYMEAERKRVITRLESSEQEVERLQNQKQLSEEDRNRLVRLNDEIRMHRDNLEFYLSESNIQRVRDDEGARQQQIKRLHEQAMSDAEDIVPQSLTVAGMGITGSFFIELTAILTIIFGIVILGILGVLGTREIAPILAAIAGYVLGKTSNGQIEPAIPSVPVPASKTNTEAKPNNSHEDENQ